MSTYWEISLTEIFDRHGLDIPAGTISSIAEDVNNAAIMKDEYSGIHLIPDPREGEIRMLKEELEREINRSFCKKCLGTGRLNVPFPGRHESSETCFYCNGKGKV